MFQPAFRLALGLLILLTAAVSLTHAQPYHDEAVRAVMATSPTCATPCWSGIRPGVTTVDQALTLLRANPWVDTITGLSEDQASTGRGAIVWSWKADKPFPVDSGYGGVMSVQSGIVIDITMPTLVTLGQTWLMLGPATLSATIHAGYPYAEYDVLYIGYPDQALTLQLTIKRPIRFSNFWGAHVTYILGAPSIGGPLRLPCWTACDR